MAELIGQVFKYQPLDEFDSIRFLLLQPGIAGSECAMYYGTVRKASPVIHSYYEDLDREREFHLHSGFDPEKSKDYSGNEEAFPYNPDRRQQGLFREVSNLWIKKLGYVKWDNLTSVRYRYRSSAYKNIWGDFHKLNHVKPPGWQRSSNIDRRITLEEIAMRHLFKIYPAKILTDRKLVNFDRDSCAIVPAETRVGDMLYFFTSQYESPLVLRPLPKLQSQSIDRMLREKSEIWGSEVQKIRHFELIGEGCLDGQPVFPYNREAVYTLETHIVALH